MNDNSLNIMFVGEAGQGLATAGPALGKSLVRAGYHLHVSQTYESRVRGGTNTFTLRTGSGIFHAPKDQVDLLLAFSREGLELYLNHMAPDGLIVSDDSLPGQGGRHLLVPNTALGKASHKNTIMLGVAAALLGLEQSFVTGCLSEQLSKLDAQSLKDNLASLEQAYQWALKQPLKIKAPLMAPAFPLNSNLMLNGNEAIALGALAGGLKLCSFYPMSPATGISLAIADHAKTMGVIVEQAEDELAAINMAIGASYAGARAMVASSGGGFALMCEGVSLAGMIEIPLVIVIAMRPGPATGLPTRTEQGDLNLALYAGHGEFPRAIFAPANPAQCFEVSKRAFALAEAYQIPVFVLTDQYLADCYSNVEPFELSPVIPLADLLPNQDSDPNYQRFKYTASGVSPRVLPGLGKTLAISDSDEHDAEGYLTEDLSWRTIIQNKRMSKLQGLTKEFIPPSFSGPENPDILLCCWGSSLGAVEEAAGMLSGQKVGVCHFSQLYPLDGSAFIRRLQAAGKVVMVESNYSGQMARLLYSETGFKVHGQVLRYDGLALTAEYIVEHLQAI